MPMETYGHIRRAAAWGDTKRFWNVHQVWKHFAAPVSGIVAGIIRMIWSGQTALLDSILTAVVWAVCFYIVAWVGTFLINYIWLAPADLYSKQHSKIAAHIEEHEAAKREIIAAHENTKQELATERQKNVRPDIQGEAFSFVPGISGETFRENKLISCHTRIQFQLSLCNHRPVLTNVKTIELDGHEMKIPAQFSQNTSPEFRDRAAPQLPFGLETTMTWSAEMEITGRQLAEICDLDFEGLKIYVVDAFGTRHPIPVRHGEILLNR
jgi:hypothetical protein